LAQIDGHQAHRGSEPLRNAFIRSDQYSFIKKGCARGSKPTSAPKLNTPDRNLQGLADQSLPRPSDDVNQPVAYNPPPYTRNSPAATARNRERFLRPQWKQNPSSAANAGDNQVPRWWQSITLTCRRR